MRRVLVLTGFDRSGTTFLGRYIQQQLAYTFFIGELDKGLRGLAGERYMKCSCGNMLPECTLWSQVIPEMKMIKDNGRDVLKAVSDKIFQLLQPKLIIDSSKDLGHVGNILTIFNKENILLHVVRNPKGVVFSRMKTRIERVKRGNHPKPEIASRTNLMMIYDSMAWSVTNVYIELFLKYKSKEYYKLIYERSETQIPIFLKTYLSDLFTHDENAAFESHVIFGNMNRFERSGSIQIDESWRENLSFFQKAAVNVITFPVRFIFNYKF